MEYYTKLNQTNVSDLFSPEEFNSMQEVEKIYPFQASPYYLSLMNPKDPNDPIKKIVIPDLRELDSSGSLDPSAEEHYTRMEGVQHKYPQTVLLLAGEACAGICRFCFRKRLFKDGEKPVTCDICKAADYIQEKPDVTDVLLSGGDSLMISPSKLDTMMTKIREIPHVTNIRLGSKLPAYNPGILLDNPDYTEVIAKHNYPEKKVHLMTHFNHPVELTDTAKSAINLIKRSGAEILNQTPVINSLNDDPLTLSTLFKKLTSIGISPYYVFQCRPTSGNHHLTVPIEETLKVMHEAQAHCSGLSKRARLIMSHRTGKIEILGNTAKHVFMKYHQVACPPDANKMLIYRSNPEAKWLEDYKYHITDMIPKMTWLF